MFSDFGFGVVQDLCAICTDFIISELWTSNFLAYQVRILLLFGLVVVRCVCSFLFILFGFPQVFAESQDYGLHGERVRNACWGYLCQSGAIELKEVRFDAIV